jgi:TolB-like protein
MGTSGYQRFFAELKRRKVFRVAAVYGAVAFVVLQVADILVPALHLPESFTTGIALVSILGFPIALVLAWAFESTPSGIQRTDPAATGEIEAIVAQPPARRWPSALLALGGIIALAVGGWLALSSRSGPAVDGGDTSTTDRAVARTASRAGAGDDDAVPARTAIAVLPFQSLTEDEESREFALGIHDDLLTQLTRIDDLRVTSRTSVMTYENSEKPARDIARELGVGSLVEGGVRSSGGRVRVNVQLIAAATDEHLWAETYDRELTAENVFAIQGEIARSVTEALEAELSPQEAAALAELPTTSTEAWAAYHRARRLWGRSAEGTYDTLIVAEYRRAVELDPEFVAAWAGLVRAQAWLIRTGEETDTVPAWTSLDSLRRLAPDAPEVSLAEAYYRYYAHADFDGALPYAQEYRQLVPGDAEGWQVEGWLLRRAGRWEESTAAQRQGAQLDPLSPVVVWNLAVNHRRQRRYGESRSLFETATTAAPENQQIRLHWLQTELYGRGDLEAARRIAADMPATSSPDAVAMAGFWVSMLAHDYDSAIDAIRDLPPGSYRFLDFPQAGGEWWNLPRSLLLSLAAHMAGDEASARSWADSSLRRAVTEVESRPVPVSGDRFAAAAVARSVMALGLALRNEPGDAEEAVRLADEAVAIYGKDRDDVDGDAIELHRLLTLLLAGESVRALDQIERLVSRPSELGPGGLNLDPIYDPVRENPRFQALVAKLDAASET